MGKWIVHESASLIQIKRTSKVTHLFGRCICWHGAPNWTWPNAEMSAKLWLVCVVVVVQAFGIKANVSRNYTVNL